MALKIKSFHVIYQCLIQSTKCQVIPQSCFCVPKYHYSETITEQYIFQYLNPSFEMFDISFTSWRLTQHHRREGGKCLSCSPLSPSPVMHSLCLWNFDLVHHNWVTSSPNWISSLVWLWFMSLFNSIGITSKEIKPSPLFGNESTKKNRPLVHLSVGLPCTVVGAPSQIWMPSYSCTRGISTQLEFQGSRAR